MAKLNKKTNFIKTSSAKITSVFKKISFKKLPYRKILPYAIVVVVLAFLFIGRSLIFAAWVGTAPIFRLTLTKELEKQGGQQVLENLIDKSLVAQEAKKANVKVTQDEVNQDITAIEASLKNQGMTLDDALSLRGQTRADLIQQITFQKEVEKLLSDKIQISDKEVADYFTANKSSFGAGATLESTKTQIKNTLVQQKLTDEYTKWLSDLKAKAKIRYFVNF